MEKEKRPASEINHRNCWCGLFSGFVADAKRHSVPPMTWVLSVDDVRSIDPNEIVPRGLSAQVKPILSWEETELPEVLDMPLFIGGKQVAKGAARAEWTRGMPIITKIEYIPGREGLNEVMIGEIANIIGQILERPDEYVKY